jgi:hypothetical protein
MFKHSRCSIDQPGSNIGRNTYKQLARSQNHCIRSSSVDWLDASQLRDGWLDRTLPHIAGRRSSSKTDAKAQAIADNRSKLEFSQLGLAARFLDCNDIAKREGFNVAMAPKAKIVAETTGQVRGFEPSADF